MRLRASTRGYARARSLPALGFKRRENAMECMTRSSPKPLAKSNDGRRLEHRGVPPVAAGTIAGYLSSGGNLKSAMFASSCTPAALISIDVER